MELQGFLELVDAEGSCVEVVSSCRALAYVAGSGVSALKPAACAECCCEPAEAGHGSTPAVDPAPWFHADQPASVDFLGLHGSLSVSPTVTTAQSGGDATAIRVTFTGALLSSSDAGRLYGWQWLTRTLEGCSPGCGTWTVKVRAFCPDLDDVVAPPTVWPNPRPVVPVDPCDETSSVEALGFPPALPAWVDLGGREIPARYVTGSLQEIPGEWPSCYGATITFSFDAIGDAWYGEPVVAGDLGWGEWDHECCECHQVTWCRPPDGDDLCGRCGTTGCGCGPVAWTTENTHPITHRPLGVDECLWSAPLCSTRATVITPALPFDAAPIFRFHGGQEDTDVLVNVWDAQPALPDPATCEGTERYGEWPLCASLQVRVPAGSVLTVDGRTGAASLLCDAARRPAGHLVTGCGGASWRLPPTPCGHRRWVAIDSDCYQPPGPGFRAVVSWARHEIMG